MSTKFTFVHRLITGLLIASLLLAANFEVFAANNAAPPPLGPPAPRDPILDLSAKFLTYGLEKGPCDRKNPIDVCGLEDGIQDAVDKLNAQIKADENKNGVRATVSWSFSYIGDPGMTATQYANRPNENFVDIPYSIDYRVYNIEKETWLGWASVPFERHLFQSINLQVFCNQWQTGHGRLKLVGKAQKPFLGDPETVEQILNIFLLNYLTTTIDNQLSQNLPPSMENSGNFPDVIRPQCDALSSHGDPLSETWDYISWSYHPPSPQPRPNPYNSISIKLIGVKRLMARDRSNAILYDVEEGPFLEMYGNYGHIGIQLPTMVEGQQVSLNGPTMTINRPTDTGILVVIADMTLWRNGVPKEEDSAFTVFDSRTNFGNGLQSLIIMKSYTVLPDPRTGGKPYQELTHGYQLFFQVTEPGDKNPR